MFQTVVASPIYMCVFFCRCCFYGKLLYAILMVFFSLSAFNGCTAFFPSSLPKYVKSKAARI